MLRSTLRNILQEQRGWNFVLDEELSILETSQTFYRLSAVTSDRVPLS